MKSESDIFFFTFVQKTAHLKGGRLLLYKDNADYIIEFCIAKTHCRTAFPVWAAKDK